MKGVFLPVLSFNFSEKYPSLSAHVLNWAFDFIVFEDYTEEADLLFQSVIDSIAFGS